jgi:hypothetical protein
MPPSDAHRNAGRPVIRRARRASYALGHLLGRALRPVRLAFAVVFGGSGLTLHEYRINIERARARLDRIERKRTRLFFASQIIRREIVQLENERSALRARLRQRSEVDEWTA